MNQATVDTIVEETVDNLKSGASVQAIRMEVAAVASRLKNRGIISSVSKDELAEARYEVSVSLSSKGNSGLTRNYDSDGNRWR